MGTSFLLSNCNLSLLTQELIEFCHPFTCGTDDDMDEFFRKDALDYTHFLMGKSYCFRLKDDMKTTGVLIGRLAVAEGFGGKGIGSDIREIDEYLYTKPPKDEAERTERLKQPRKLRTRLMFCDLLEEYHR